MRTDAKFLKVILAICVVGILVSGWLLSVHIRFTSGQATLTETCSALPGAAGHGCATVAVSAYSDILGVPLAGVALGFYFAIFFLTLWAMRNPQTSYEIVHVAFFLSTLSILLTVRMAYLSHFVVKSFCIGCATLWLVNLALWPAFVQHMKLSWGNALAANLELFRPGKYNLLRNRIYSALGVSAFFVLILATIGTVAENMQKDEALFGGEDRAIQSYQEAKIVFLPPESVGGPQSQGVQDATPVLDIVEFSDLQCPACRMAARFLKPFLLKYPSKVRFTYRHYPLDPSCNSYVPNGMHIFGCAAAKAGICAAKQNKFFEFHDYVFDNQESLSNGLLEEAAKAVELDMTAFQACLQDKNIDLDLQKQIEMGERTGGIESTPTLIINGHKMMGALTPVQLEAIYQAALHAHR